MARAETEQEDRKFSFLSSASFRSATSYASFRSFKSIKSSKSLGSRASFKSVVSRDDGSNYYSCHDSMSTKTGIVNEGYLDNVSFYSLNDYDLPSIAAVAPNQRQRSVSHSGEIPSDMLAKDVDKEDIKGTPAYKYLGYLGVLVAATAVAGSTTVISLVPSLSPWVLLVYRSILQVVTSLPLMLGTRSNCLGPPGYRWRLYLTGLLTGFLLLALYLAISTLPPRIVAPILMTTPVVTVFLSWMVLREHLGLYRMLTTSLLVAGVVLLTRPPPLFPSDPPDQLQVNLAQYNLYGYPAHFHQSDHSSTESLSIPVDTLGLMAAMVAPFLAAALVILTRQCREVHFSVLLFWSALGSLLIGCVGLYTLDKSGVVGEVMEAGRDAREISVLVNDAEDIDDIATVSSISTVRIFEGPTEWLVATLVAFLGITVNVLVLKALHYIPPGKILLLKSGELVAGYVLHLCVGGVAGVGAQAVLQWLDLGGAVCVGLAVIFAGFEELIVDSKRWRWF
eukprot:TRINITY_DN8492_c0_g1_i1.p1 TRINITY_DN8492_c0_g1~~TRINITY_DN8492_c0_g1_i1.p1  ORF type:complete len:507 (-),score=134.66 TRINITY_DN8492_c0_g1_i1:237-1757(-)